jgi:serine/threonine protein kinase
MNIDKVVHLGAGAYGDVYKTIDKNNHDNIVALKVMKNDPANNDIREATIREIMNTQNLAHPNIISVDPLVYEDGSRHAVYINEPKRRIELSLEMMSGDVDSLYEEELTSDILRKLVYDVTKGLYHMHSMGYTHNDLKPENILYKLEGANYTFKIGDFGLSQYLGIPFPNLVNNFLCTPTVKAPDAINSSYFVEGNTYNYNSDMFSLGATMFWICMKKHNVTWPSFRINDTDVFVDIRKPNFLAQVDRLKEMYGDDGYDFLIKCMEPKSSERMSSKKALEHPYLRPMRGGAFENLLEKIQRLYKEPTAVEITNGIYELEYLDDMYNVYKNRRVDLYIDFRSTVDLIPVHMIIMNDWAYEVFNTFRIQSMETFFQFQINFINLLRKKNIDRSNLQLWGICTLNISHKMCSSFYARTIGLPDLMWITQNSFTEQEILDTSNELLNTFDTNIPLTPIMFFLNYWYLKSIYTSVNKVPNVKVLTTSLAVMLALFASNNTQELQNVKIDELAKYCVHKALFLENYYINANVHILTGHSSVDWDVLNTCISDFCSNAPPGLKLINNMKELLRDNRVV